MHSAQIAHLQARRVPDGQPILPIKDRERELARSRNTSKNEKTSENVKAVRRIRMATAASNADILSDMRTVVRRQLELLRLHGNESLFSAAQGSLLHKLAQTYSILDSHTDKEHQKYDFSDRADAELERLAAAARQFAVPEDDD